ncbi:MAG: hypothetical protein ACOC3Z_03610 [Nanoarchaeota archaeon]
MVKKKSVKKKATKKKVVKKKATKKKKKSNNRINYSKAKFKFVLNKLFVFLTLFVLSFVIYFSSSDMIKDVFSLLALIFGLICVALLIVVLIFVFLRLLNK